MGLLRKLAELVVEFPDQPPAAEKQSSSGDDALAAIEEIRRGLEQGNSPDFAAAEEEPAEESPEPAAQPRMTGMLGQESPEVHSGIKMPAIFAIQQVYERAGIKPDAEGFDLARLQQMLADPEIADLPLEIRARSVKASLKAVGKELRDIIEEAARRDQALEDYLVYLDQRVEQVDTQVASANIALKNEIDAFVAAKTAAIEANKQKLHEAKAALADFRRSKASEEQKLYETVAPFVQPGENPVVVSDDPPLGGSKG